MTKIPTSTKLRYLIEMSPEFAKMADTLVEKLHMVSLFETRSAGSSQAIPLIMYKKISAKLQYLRR